MRNFLFLLSGLAFLVGMAVLIAAKSAIHEIEAFILFLIAAVLFVGAAVVKAIMKCVRMSCLLEHVILPTRATEPRRFPC
ncbi:MAG: hypothetical protein JWM11_436 [Planctomycetaceae bacterium]|nr:hypothetical protein [Planctomycetaceae bacterium]